MGPITVIFPIALVKRKRIPAYFSSSSSQVRPLYTTSYFIAPKFTQQAWLLAQCPRQTYGQQLHGPADMVEMLGNLKVRLEVTNYIRFGSNRTKGVAIMAQTMI